MPELDGFWLTFGVNTNAIIKITGTKTPNKEYSSGLLELRQAKHQIIENMIAIMIIKVPTPTPRTRAEVVDWHSIISNDEASTKAKIAPFMNLNCLIINLITIYKL